MHLILLLLALLTWPFGPSGHLNQKHTRRHYATRLAHIKQARAHRLSHGHHAEHASLIHF